MISKIRCLGLALGILVLASACAQVAGTGRSQLRLVSESELVPIAARQYRQILSKGKISTSGLETQMVRSVGARIQAAAETYLAMFSRQNEIAAYSWEFNLLESPEANAFCMPGGKVAVYSGLLPIAQTEAGLAAVMGHEVAHAIAHHGSERASQQMMTSLGAQVLSLGLGLGGSSQITGDVVMTAYGLGSQVGILLPFSRTHEAEADRIGLSLMAMAGYDPAEAVSFWERMSASQNGRRRAPAEFLSTHPADRTRMENLRSFLPEAESRYIPFKPAPPVRSGRSGRSARRR
jgi:predicted Zn-dependent protease